MSFYVVDGEEWEEGTDYTTSSGSTIITIEAARLELLDAGLQLLTLVFEHETIELAFTLLKPLPPLSSAETNANDTDNSIYAADIGDTILSATPNTANRGSLPFILAIAAPLVLAAAVVCIYLKKKTVMKI